MTSVPPRVLFLFAASVLVWGTTARAAEEKSAEESARKRPAEVVVLQLEGPITDKPMAEDFPFGPMKTESLHSLVTRIDKAAQDQDVAAAILLWENTQMGPAQTAEVRAALDRFKSAGKPVYAHADSLQMGSYLLLSGASRLSVVPTGDVWITGLYGEQLYVRGLLDMLGVKPDFLTCGAYKSAAEMFMRNGPSPEAEEMYGWLFDGLYEASLKLIASGRHVDVAQVRAWVDEGMYSAERALKRGVIDAVESRADFLAHVRKQHGEDLKLDRDYGKASPLAIDLNNPFAAFQLWAQILAGPQTKKSTKDAIAIVHVEGPIMTGQPEVSPFGATEGAYSTPLRKALEEVARDETIKAVVLRVNSPGGSAVASDIILDATKQVKDRKPLVVSMGDVAGSGGYYVACGADTIFADEATITGSIGVVAGKLATTDMWRRWGIHWNPIARGQNSGILSSANVFTPEEREKVQGWMDEVYEVFQGHVTAIRGDRLKKPLDDLAGGRVYTGLQALELGLVDQIGGLDAAIAHAAKSADLETYEVRVVPRPKNFMEVLLEDLQPSRSNDDKSLSLRLLEISPELEAMDPQRLAALRSGLRQLDILQREGVMLTMPVWYWR
jgi:protease-4